MARGALACALLLPPLLAQYAVPAGQEALVTGGGYAAPQAQSPAGSAATWGGTATQSTGGGAGQWVAPPAPAPAPAVAPQDPWAGAAQSGGGMQAGGMQAAGGMQTGGVQAGGVQAGGVQAGGVQAGGAQGGWQAGGTQGGGMQAGGGGGDSYGTYAPYYTTTTKKAPAPAPVLKIIPGMPNNLAEITHFEQKLPTEPWQAEQGATCGPFFQVPQAAPLRATDYNGLALPDACFMTPSNNPDGKHHVQVVGDWGGLMHHPWNQTVMGPLAADHRDKNHFKQHYRPYVFDVDDFAQARVAEQMQKRAMKYDPDYILNVGDSFYWGGISARCGAPVSSCADVTGQWKGAFEDMYTGPGIDGKQWLGVLGNHDYGGYMFSAGWDQIIAYTWLKSEPSTQRWVVPGQYWKVTAKYPDFSIDYLFVDTNVFDTWLPKADQAHNICSHDHNVRGWGCGIIGPTSPENCPKWFHNLWDAQLQWMDSALGASVADWQIIVVHHPPEGMWGAKDWSQICPKHGVDLIIAGHRHRQEVHGPNTESNQLRPTAYIVSGGGGGITAENTPEHDGQDDEYGFVDLTLTKEEIMVEAISHTGEVRSTTCVRPRQPGSMQVFATGPSMCDGVASGPRPETLPPDAYGNGGGIPVTSPNGGVGGQDAWGQPWQPAPAPAPWWVALNPFAPLVDRLRR